MKKITTTLKKVETYVISVTFIIMILAVFLQVIDRNILKIGIQWTEELARYSMVWMILVGTEACFREGNPIAIEFIVKLLPEMVKKIIVEVVCRLIVTAFAGIVFYYSFQVLGVQMSSGQISPALSMPLYIPYFAVTLSSFLIIINQLFNIILTFIKRDSSIEKNEEGCEVNG